MAHPESTFTIHIRFCFNSENVVQYPVNVTSGDMNEPLSDYFGSCFHPPTWHCCSVFSEFVDSEWALGRWSHNSATLAGLSECLSGSSHTNKRAQKKDFIFHKTELRRLPLTVYKWGCWGNVMRHSVYTVPCMLMRDDSNWLCSPLHLKFKTLMLFACSENVKCILLMQRDRGNSLSHCVNSLSQFPMSSL